MNVAPQPGRGRGLELLVAHVRSLDPETPTAKDRLEQVIGRDLAHRLVFALCGGGDGREHHRRAA
jgi:hypothetical protein